MLHHVFCQQSLTLPSVAVMNSHLTISLIQTHPFRPHSLRTGHYPVIYSDIELGLCIVLSHVLLFII